MEKRCGTPQNSILGRDDSISDESIGSASRSSTATMIMSVSGEDENVPSLRQNESRTLKRKRNRLNSDFIQRRNRSIFSIGDRNNDSSYHRKVSWRVRDDFDLLRCSQSSDKIRVGSFQSSEDLESTNAGMSFHQVAFLVQKHERSSFHSLLKCLDVATAAILCPWIPNGKCPCGSRNHSVESFSAVLSQSNIENSFVEQPRLKFESPDVTINKMQAQLFPQAKLSIEKEPICESTTYVSKGTLAQLSTSIHYLCNSLPWNHNLNNNQQQVKKSIYVLLPDLIIDETLSSSPPSIRMIRRLKTDLMEQPAGGINLYFVNTSFDFNAHGHQPQQRNEMHSINRMMLSADSCFPRWNLKDLYSYTSTYLSLVNSKPISMCDDKADIPLKHILRSLQLDFTGSVTIDKEDTINEPLLKFINSLSNLKCTYVPLFSPSCSPDHNKDGSSFFESQLLPQRLEVSHLIKNANQKETFTTEEVKSTFVLCFSSGSDDTVEDSSSKDASNSNDQLSSFLLLSHLRLQDSALLFCNKGEKEVNHSSFILKPLSAFTASLEVIASVKTSECASIARSFSYAPSNAYIINNERSLSDMFHFLSIVNLDFSLESIKTEAELAPNASQKKASSTKRKSAEDGKKKHGDKLSSNDQRVRKYASCIPLSTFDSAKSQQLVVKQHGNQSKTKEDIKYPSKSSFQKPHHDSSSLATMSPLDLPKQRPSSNIQDKSNQLSLLYKNCIDTNNPSPIELVTKVLPSTACSDLPLSKSEVTLEPNDEKSRKKLLLKANMLQLCINAADISRISANDDEREKQRKLRIMQLQILLRMQLLVVSGQCILDVNSSLDIAGKKHKSSIKKGKKKKIRSRKNKDKYPCLQDDIDSSQFIQYIESLLSLVRFGLPKTAIFVAFFQENITAPFCSSLSSIVKEISDSFDITIPAESTKDPRFKSESESRTNMGGVITTVPRQNSATKSFSFLSASTAGETKKNGSHNMKLDTLSSGRGQFPLYRAASEGSTSSSISNSKENFQVDSLLKRSASLKKKSRSRNPLLADGKVEYLGSHFNRNLSSVSTLFREVKLIRRVTTQSPEVQQSNTREASKRIEQNKKILQRGKRSLSSSTGTKLSRSISNIRRNDTTPKLLSKDMLSPSRADMYESGIIRETPIRKPKLRKVVASPPIFGKSPENKPQSAAILVAAAAFAARKQRKMK